ncbi:hypothetical protein NC797_10100 [Aquibacillus sp. 3ASR75-11]|uniref:Uncharacterized protein n=1 Tax=Terrihalobacillus insolitus TaxID=2950438 RepID=A0A9X3WVJ2_9BACI|nr:hypothetical protein [Terrihalobacillus insolitus]MDC3413119.1 hypothetical protein [Terrihalobacillus insolitus]MDC3424861.1 hypothetical protein [Terrihalobacillus insolitus]
MKRIIDEEAAKREAELNIQEAKQKAEQKVEQTVKEAKEHNEEIARRLLTKGMSVKEVAEIIDLDVDRVRKIKLDM